MGPTCRVSTRTDSRCSCTDSLEKCPCECDCDSPTPDKRRRKKRKPAALLAAGLALPFLPKQRERGERRVEERGGWWNQGQEAAGSMGRAQTHSLVICTTFSMAV